MKDPLQLEYEAREILNWSRRKLAQKLPEFLPAIYLLALKQSEKPGHLWTDGSFLYYDPLTVVQDYLARKDDIAAQIMHIISHGLLGHIPKREGQQPVLFDAAADIKVSAFVDQLPTSLTPRLNQSVRQHRDKWDSLTLEAIYLSPESREEAEALVQMSEPLQVDDHSGWALPHGENGTGGAMAQQWQAAARQVAQAIAQSGRSDQFGNLPAAICEEFGGVQESSVSYKEFLRQFCSQTERQEVDPDSISHIWYRIGMDITGDAPFVEPEELREEAPCLDLAVALDTSGSCCGPVMQEFLEELLAILRDAGGPRVELTLIQCDAEIQCVQTLTREDTVNGLMEQFEVHGFGGTDFRPVFQYIEQRRQEPEGKPFRGLLYLSDGFGDFPQEAPDYPVAFLFPRDEEPFGMGWSPIPDWVTRVHINQDNRLVVQQDDRR